MGEVTAAWVAPSAPASAATAPAQLQGTEPSARQIGAPGGGKPRESRGHEGLRPIPLRPLSVLELIDGAIGAVRALPGASLAWGSLAVAAITLLATGALSVFDAAVSAATRVHPLVSVDDFGVTVLRYGKPSGTTVFGLVLVHALLPMICTGMVVTVLAGLFAEPVKRYIDGATTASTATTASAAVPTAGAAVPQAPAQAGRARPSRHVAALCVIALVTAVPRLIMVALIALITVNDANNPVDSLAGVIFLVLLVGVPICAWLAAEWAVAAPALALEGIKASTALGRARALVAHGRWRTMWAAALTLLIVNLAVGALVLCQYYIFFAHGLRQLIDGNPVGGATYWWFAGYLLVAVLTQVLAAPIRATVAAMQYTDRRFRREGLDIRIAWARVARNGGGQGR